MRITDGDFVDSDWQLTHFSNDPDVRVRTEWRMAGGKPGPFRVIRHGLPAAGPGTHAPHVVSLHRYLGATYQASRSGPIETICYEEDAFVLQGFGQGQSTGPALWQAGRIFVAAIGNTGVPATWRHWGPRIFGQDDFHEVRPGALRDPSSHPDFSARGNAIDVGFQRSNTSRASGYILVGAIDNWSVEINCSSKAEPPSSPSPSPSPTVTPTVTASPSPTVTPTVTLSPTASQTTTPTSFPTASSTPSPSPLYLPLLLHERCPPSNVFADIALVIDASTTMREPSPSGPLKIDVAIAATRGFLAGLRLRPGADRVSLVTFNAEAMTLSALTDDRDLLERSLGRVVIREQSRIDLGLLAGAQSLSAARPNAMRSLILLSDGMANPAPTSDVLTAASSARKAGITLYVVGLGPSMDRSVLRAIAGDPTRYFPSEDPDLLSAIYAELARRVPCPRDAYWGRR